jgi:hypothetical protein
VGDGTLTVHYVVPLTPTTTPARRSSSDPSPTASAVADVTSTPVSGQFSRPWRHRGGLP